MKNKKIGLYIATLGVGQWAPWMGTVGSLISLPLCMFVVYTHSLIVLAVVSLLTLLVGVWSVPHAEALLGPKMDPFGKVRDHDHNQIAIDETLGMLVGTTALLLMAHGSWVDYGVLFVVFRFFDVAKLWPASYFDNIQSPWAVMLDDVCAGVYTAIVLYGLFIFI